MATPKGTRSYRLPVGETDAVHVYSNTEGIWIQLRRLVATEDDISNPSFKVALELTPEIARLLGAELAKVAESPGPRRKSTGAAKVTAALKLGICPICKETKLIEHHGRGWCPLCGKFDRRKEEAILPPAEPKPEKKKPVVHDFINGFNDDL